MLLPGAAQGTAGLGPLLPQHLSHQRRVCHMHRQHRAEPGLPERPEPGPPVNLGGTDTRGSHRPEPGPGGDTEGGHTSPKSLPQCPELGAAARPG